MVRMLQGGRCGDALLEILMKPEIHPPYNTITVVCNCENTFKTRSTSRSEKMLIDVCDQCHPFYTGQHKVVDTAGRIDKFNRRYGVRKESSESEG